jgi:hypothetical protein
MPNRQRTAGATGIIALGVAVFAGTAMISRGSESPSNADLTADKKQMEASWADLEKGEVEASRALLDLADRAKEAVPFLKDKLKPLTIPSGEVKRLLLKLNSADEHVWRPAFEELEYFDPRLAIELPDLMERVTESPARQRLVELLCERDVGSLAGREIQLRPVRAGFNFVSPKVGSWWAEPKVAQLDRALWVFSKKKWKRADRAIVLLERCRTPEAVSILKDMATGHPDAMPTKVAKEALEKAATGDEEPMEALWAHLEKSEVEASRALLDLYNRPKEAVTFLKDKLKPLTISSGEVKRLLLKLNSADEKLWKSAFEELEYFDPRLAIELPDLMERVTESPARQRLAELLSERDAGSLAGMEVKLRKFGGGFNFSSSNRSWWAESKVSAINTVPWSTTKRKWTRANRAIVLLEHLRSPVAISILKEMATGHPEAQPTKVAKQALERIAGKSI